MKVLRLSTCHGPIDGQGYNLSKYNPEIENLYLFSGKTYNIDFDAYDVVWFYTDERFPVEFPELLEAAARSNVRKVNFDVATCQTQDKMTEAWHNAGLPVPVCYGNYKKGERPDFSAFPTDFPYMVKAARSYPRIAHATVINNEEDFDNWEHKDRYNYFIQDYVTDYGKPDNDDLYYCGQVYNTGNRIFERSIRWTNHWYVSPSMRGAPHLGLILGKGCFEHLPMYRPDVMDQIAHIFNIAKVDVGLLDFSLNSQGEVIPWGICTNHILYTEGKEASKKIENFPTTQEQIPMQREYWNGIMSYIGISPEYYVTDNDIWRVLECYRLNL